MANPLRQQIEQISREKNINPDIVVAAIEDAILTASKKYYKNDEDLRSRFNNESGLIEVFAVRQVVAEVETPATQISLEEARKLIPEAEVGAEIEFPKPTDVLGRIAAQTAKQVIFQKVREAERDNVYGEYSGRVGEVLNGMIKRQEMGDFIVDLGRGVEAILPRKEQSRAETYQTGDRVRVAIVRVLKSAKGPQVVVSRTDPALLIKLFEMEVPEIYDGTVQIKGCVREAGERAKVAVISREKDVDPVGACVGMKGTRVQSIIRELRGEKIDIVEWSEDALTFVEKALSPAKISRATIVDEEQRIMEVVVEDRQLSLAIGKKGQNVRLAAKLVGWRIDIKSEEEKRQEVEAEMARMQRMTAELRSLPHVGEKVIEKLLELGVQGLDHVLQMTDEELTEIEGIGPKTAEKLREAAIEARADWERRDAEEAQRLEAERVEAERLEAERVATEAAEQAAADQAAAEQAAAEAADAETGAEVSATGADVPSAEAEIGGAPDAER
jgi:transcription termination/antitermination protein NusA